LRPTCRDRSGSPFLEKLTVVAPALLICGATVADPAGAELTIDRLSGPMVSSFAAGLERPAYLETEPTLGQCNLDPRPEAPAQR